MMTGNYRSLNSPHPKLPCSFVRNICRVKNDPQIHFSQLHLFISSDSLFIRNEHVHVWNTPISSKDCRRSRCHWRGWNVRCTKSLVPQWSICRFLEVLLGSWGSWLWLRQWWKNGHSHPAPGKFPTSERQHQAPTLPTTRPSLKFGSLLDL
jgi:hypothetical protein